jgi:hypothetical protein
MKIDPSKFVDKSKSLRAKHYPVKQMQAIQISRARAQARRTTSTKAKP